MDNARNSAITIVIPAFNEEGTIAEIIKECNQMGYRDVLVIDGNSSDRTVEIAKELGANIVLQDGKGKGNALRQAFNCSHLKGNVVVMMDADGSMDPKEIPNLIEHLDSGADLVKGSRFLESGRTEDMSLVRRIGNMFFLFCVNKFWSAGYTDLCYGLGAFRRDAVVRLCPYLKSKNFEIETEVFIKAKKLGLKVVEVPSIESRRKFGKSNLRAFRDGFRILNTIFEELVK